MAPLMTHTGQYHYLNDKVNLLNVDLLELFCVFPPVKSEILEVALITCMYLQ